LRTEKETPGDFIGRLFILDEHFDPHASGGLSCKNHGGILQDANDLFACTPVLQVRSSGCGASGFGAGGT